MSEMGRSPPGVAIGVSGEAQRPGPPPPPPPPRPPPTPPPPIPPPPAPPPPKPPPPPPRPPLPRPPGTQTRTPNSAAWHTSPAAHCALVVHSSSPGGAPRPPHVVAHVAPLPLKPRQQTSPRAQLALLEQVRGRPPWHSPAATQEAAAPAPKPAMRMQHSCAPPVQVVAPHVTGPRAPVVGGGATASISPASTPRGPPASISPGPLASPGVGARPSIPGAASAAGGVRTAPSGNLPPPSAPPPLLGGFDDVPSSPASCSPPNVLLSPSLALSSTSSSVRPQLQSPASRARPTRPTVCFIDLTSQHTTFHALGPLPTRAV